MLTASPCPRRARRNLSRGTALRGAGSALPGAGPAFVDRGRRIDRKSRSV